MQFSNEPIDINALPKFEEVHLQPLQPNYFKVLALNVGIFFGILFIGILVLYFVSTEEFIQNNIIYFVLSWLFLVSIIFWYQKASFKKRGFAFRTHDAIYKSGLLSETTTIIPFNRVQHVALHQGFISRKLGLATIELFTAGGSSSDLKIPGLLFSEAQKIKNLVSQKINEAKQETQENSIEIKSNTEKEDESSI